MLELTTPQDQAAVNQAARDFATIHTLRTALTLANDKADRLQRAIMAAQMHLSIQDHKRAYQILTQALHS